jgi:hypothetical protein
MGMNNWGLYFQFTSYDIKNLYSRNYTDFGYCRSIIGKIYASAELSFNNENFRHDNIYSGLELTLKSTCQKGPLIATIGLGAIPIRESYSSKEFFQPLASLSYESDYNIIFSIAAKKFSNGFTRLHFAQSGKLIKQVDFNIGYMNNPGTYYAGLDFQIKYVKFNVSYYGVGKLNNSIILGIGFFR